MSNEKFIVAEVTKNWQQFEAVININSERGYRLIDWKLNVSSHPDLFTETIIAIFEFSGDESAANNGIDGDDFYGVKIFKNDRVNSVLNAAIRFLDDEQMIALRDCLIKRTPANNGIGDEKDKEIERLICLIEQRERSTHYTFYANTTTMTSTEIEEQFKKRWEQFKKENNL